jgi:hypothetical protein
MAALERFYLLTILVAVEEEQGLLEEMLQLP